MSSDWSFEIRKFDFGKKIFDNFQNIHEAKALWPVVYILSDGKIRQAYVGETTDAFSRMGAHLTNNEKSNLTAVHLITSNKFNKSATLDIESNLIKYISGDGQFKLLNGNLGVAYHEYYQKREYWEIFDSIWDKLRSEGIAKHSIEHINNSDLFKYSPFKSLSREQQDGLRNILLGLLNDEFNHFIIEGGAGTGKTILAIFLFKLLNSDNQDFNFKEFNERENEFIDIINKIKSKFPNPKMALVVPMASFRKTLQKVFSNVKGLKPSMVIGPADVAKEKFDILVVDESHRLRRRVNLGTYFAAFDKACEQLKLDKNKCSELDWMIKQSKKAILFYDENQSIKPSDAMETDFQNLKKHKGTTIQKLKSQFRVQGGNGYVKFIDDLLNVRLDKKQGKYIARDYEFIIFDDLSKMVSEIKKRDEEVKLSRLIAGYSWKWISKENKSLYDIVIDDIKLQWNGTANDWINSENAINEVGCIHTTQGYDLNYAGIIFGNEITYDKKNGQIKIVSDNYFDRNGKLSISNPDELKRFIINIYKTIMLRGIKGTYVYVCDQNLREYLSQFIPNFESSIETTNDIQNEIIPFVNSVPLYDLKVAAGGFSELQKSDIIKWLPVPKSIKITDDLFVCKVVGESMNRIIPNGSVCLFRKYSGGSRNGKIVLVSSQDIHDSDFGSGFTVKEYYSLKSEDENGWKHQSIVLKPKSSDKSYSEIILKNEQLEKVNVIGVFERVLK